MKYFVIGILTALCLPLVASAQTSYSIGFIGDSITAGVGAQGTPAADAMIADLNAKGIKATGVNRGVNGTASFSWLPGQGQKLLPDAITAFAAAHVDTVLVMLGTNDCKQRYITPTNPAQLVENLSQIVAALHAAGIANVIINEPPYATPGADKGTWNEASTTLLEQYLPLLDTIRGGIKGDRTAYHFFKANPGCLNDGIHPNQKGHSWLGLAWEAAFIAAIQPAVTQNHQLSGAVIGTPGSYQNDGHTAADAFDGNINTTFDGPTPDGCWCGLDFGTPQTITSIRFAPRPGFEWRMGGGVFQASNDPTFATSVDLLRLDANPPPGYSMHDVTVAGAYRYARYLSPPKSYGNIAEVEFYGGGAKAATQPASTPTPPSTPAAPVGMRADAPADNGTPAEPGMPGQVDAAIAKAVRFLESTQKGGNWEAGPVHPDAPAPDPNGGQWGGTTAIVTYGLLCAGEKQKSPQVSAAIDFLAAHPAHGVYASASRCLVWSRIDLSPATRAAAMADVKFLLSAAKKQGAARGLFSYVPPTDPTDANYDHSASQFAALGLSMVVSQGLEIPQDFWRVTDQAWRDQQNPDGAWSYVFNSTDPAWATPTVSMTAAGVATLFITQSLLREGVGCRGNDPDPNIIRGIRWLSNAGGDALVSPERGYAFQNYALFTASRVGVASGYKYFGTTDWYQKGAQFLIAGQHPEGSWSGYGPVPAETALALLFLTYGSAPITFNKLEYTVAPDRGHPVPAHWNQRPQDLLNLTDWMGRQLERRLNWQIVTLSSATLDDLHEAPVLFISGDQSLDFSSDECAKLRQFIEEGGCILGNADCDSRKFAKSFEKLGTSMFPKFEFRNLPPNHPIFTDEQYPASKWQRHPALRGLSNGVRELMLLCGADLSRDFQARNSKVHAETFQLADDIVLYCVETSALRRKGETYIVRENPAAPVERTIKVARLQYNGNWDPEPGGWRQLKAVLHNSYRIALDVEPLKLGSPIPADVQLAHLTGTESLQLDAAQRASLLAFVQAGGTLVIDGAGKLSPFTESVEAQLTTMFGKDATAGLAMPLPISSAVYALPNLQIDAVSYRRFARASTVGSLSSPRIFGISRNGRVAVFYSREDISSGLVGAPIDGIVGYTPQSATALMRNIIIYAAQPH